MMNSAMSFVLLEGRSFTTPVPLSLSRNFHDQELLATIWGLLIGHQRYLCITQPPSTTFAQGRVVSEAPGCLAQAPHHSTIQADI